MVLNPRWFLNPDMVDTKEKREVEERAKSPGEILLHLLDRQFYEFLQVDWATFLTYSLNMECTYFLKARELPC